MTGHHKMLLLSAPIVTNYPWLPGLRCRPRRRAGVRLIDQSIATKLWHMACVCGRGM